MGDGLQEPIANLIDDQILTLILVMTSLWCWRCSVYNSGMVRED